jgi:hypothetical protein
MIVFPSSQEDELFTRGALPARILIRQIKKSEISNVP